MLIDDQVKAPFTKEEAEKLNQYQKLGFLHEFTCPNKHPDRTLIAKEGEGWHCPHCDYTQNWAHLFMLNIEEMKANWNNNFGKIMPV